MVNWVVLGAGGMLGKELVDLLPRSQVKSLTKSQCDITNKDALAEALQGADVVVNCAAWTAVDAAEDNEETAYNINALGAKNVAEICAAKNSKMVQISTDYIFAGNQTTPITVKELPEPKSAYGRTKLAGEKFVNELLPTSSYIIRTSWLYGKNGGNFVKTMLKLEKEKEKLEVVNDQFGQPTWTLDLAKLIIRIVEHAPGGTFHGTSTGKTNWAEFAKEIFLLKGADPKRIVEISSEKFIRPAQRPKFSVLDHSEFTKLGIKPIRDWRAALHDAYAQNTFTNL